MVLAGVYGAVLHYLKAIERAKPDDGATVVKTMKDMRPGSAVRRRPD